MSDYDFAKEYHRQDVHRITKTVTADHAKMGQEARRAVHRLMSDAETADFGILHGETNYQRLKDVWDVLGQKSENTPRTLATVITAAGKLADSHAEAYNKYGGHTGGLTIPAARDAGRDGATGWAKTGMEILEQGLEDLDGADAQRSEDLQIAAAGVLSRAVHYKAAPSKGKIQELAGRMDLEVTGVNIKKGNILVKKQGRKIL